MTVKTRKNKIENAKVTISNVSHKTGLVATVQGSDSKYHVRSLPAKRVGRGYIYKMSCQNGQACLGNKKHWTACYHTIAALQEVYQLAGFIFAKCDNSQDAIKLLNFDEKATLIKIVSEGNGSVYCTAQLNPNAPSALDNLKQLIEEKRIALKPSGIMPIGRKVQLFRRKDDKLVFRQGTKFSKPVAFWGQDRSGFGEHVGVWKLTEDTQKNWEEFLRCQK